MGMHVGYQLCMQMPATARLFRSKDQAVWASEAHVQSQLIVAVSER